MDIEQFRKIDASLRSGRPKPFLLIPPDAPASSSALAAVEESWGVTLPRTYKEFLAEFGGGSFGLTNVCSADPNSDFDLPNKQFEVAAYAPQGVIAISDDAAGGLYVLKVVDGATGESVHYWNADGGLVATPFSNVLEFVARYAYQPA